MKRIIDICLFCSIIGTLFPAYLGAQETTNRLKAAMDSVINPSLFSGSEGILRFDSVKVYIGTLSEDDAPRTCHFRFRNVSRSSVSITRVSTSCGCTASEFPRKPLAPGAEGVITLTYNPRNHPGTVDTRAFVYTTVSGTQPVARLTLLGNVVSTDEWRHLPHVAGGLRMKRKQVVFSDITSSMQPSERILCANGGTASLKLSALMLPPYAGFRTEPAILEPGREGELIITIDGSKLPAGAGKELRFSFLLEGVDVRPSHRTMEVIIKRAHK